MSGIVGVVTDKQIHAANSIIYGAYALQHRGQINTGVALLEYHQLYVRKGSGQINALFPDNVSMNIPGDRGLAHVKYGEYAKYDVEQPIMPKEYKIDGMQCLISIDGNILNPDFSLHGLVKALHNNLAEAKAYLAKLQGAFAGIYLDPYKMIAFRDPLGLKPICAGKFVHGYIVASETCAIDACGADLIRPLENGEMLVIQNGKIEFHRYCALLPKKKCIFELVYTSRPDSHFDGLSVYQARSKMGQILYEECPTAADIVMGAPDSGLIAAVGYAEASKIPYKDGIIKNRYVGRTFLTTDENERKTDIFIKLNPIKEVLKNQRVILVDDSIVKGSTTKRTIRMLKNAGAKEVHVRISSPVLRFPCNLSMDTPRTEELIAYQRSVEEVRQIINADSLYYISMEGLKSACQGMDFCDHCFSGDYPIKEYEADLWE